LSHHKPGPIEAIWPLFQFRATFSHQRDRLNQGREKKRTSGHIGVLEPEERVLLIHVSREVDVDEFVLGVDRHKLDRNILTNFENITDIRLIIEEKQSIRIADQGTLLDRHRPLWEYHLIEGLADGRFATYSKIHHSLADGVGLVRQILESLSTDPKTRDIPPMWVPGAAAAEEENPNEGSRSGTSPLDIFRGAARTLSSTARTLGGLSGVGPMLAKYGAGALLEQTMVLPYGAPRTMLNQPISGSRRIAAQSWDISRVLKAGKARGVTLNDMVLAMSSGALRRYLIANDALPDEPLIASVPVSIRTGGDSGGNAITFVLCNLGTHLEDPDDRLEAITSSMRATKAVMADRSSVELAALGILTAVGPSALTRIPGSANLPPPYNVLISNVPGPRQKLYWNGAELEAIYPLSIPTEDQALNITCLSYADHLEFGLVGCRRSIPKLQRLLDYLEESLQELE
jgi:WS/DGAT/MGAT family acyltransferase